MKVRKRNLNVVTVVLGVFILTLPSRVEAQEVIGYLSNNGSYVGCAFFLWLINNILKNISKNSKKIFDVCLSLLILIITSPIVLICVLFIKIISPKGSVIYVQKRVGKNGKVFNIYKLRSMRFDAERLTGAVWSSGEKDTRVIPFIGKFMRTSHVDEIPQFFNVLLGDMGIVGPRPERPEIVADLINQIPEYEKRLEVLPGITGLAQIRHPYDKTLRDVKKKVKLDLLYIRKISFWNELSILLRTFIVVVKRKTI